MLDITIDKTAIRFGPHAGVSFHRTLRIPDDGREYPLPPGLGALPIFRVADYRDRLPQSWQTAGGGFIPLYQREALWLGFHGPDWRSQALKVAVGGINTLSGDADASTLSADPQDYLVIPDQPWLDGINTGHGSVRQFVAMPLGQGATVEAALTGREGCGGIQLTVFEPRPGKFPDEPPLREKTPLDPGPGGQPQPMATPAMGLGAGGRLRQKIYPDPFGIDTWDPANFGRVVVHILNSRQFTAVTGQPPPPSPIDAVAYARYGFPWFARYDDDQADIAPSEKLAATRTLGEHDAAADRDELTALEIADTQIQLVGGCDRRVDEKPKPDSTH